MTGSRHPLLRFTGAAAALLLLFPRLALGDFGICPPYSQTFGPDDSFDDISAFVAEVNARPGGGTLILEGGSYPFDLEEDQLYVSGTLCVRTIPVDGNYGDFPVILRAQSGGIVTIRETYGAFGAVESAALLFVDDSHLAGISVNGSAYARDSILDHISSGGVFAMVGGEARGYFSTSDIAYTSVTGATAVGIENRGTLVVSGSTLRERTSCPDSGEPCERWPAIDNDDIGIAEVADSLVETCERGPVVDLGYNRFRADGGCIVTDPTSTYYEESVEAVVRTTPYWKQIGEVDLSTENALFVAVFSGESLDATTILIESISIDFFYARVRGPAYSDSNGDGLLDLVFWYRLDRDLDLECGNYNQGFEAMTADGQTVTGLLRFKAVGCGG